MKTKLSMALLLGLFIIGSGMTCQPSDKRRAYNAMATVAYTTDAAYKTYLDLVVTDKVSPRGMGEVANAYRAFQATYGATLALVQFTSEPATPAVIEASAAVMSAIEKAKVLP